MGFVLLSSTIIPIMATHEPNVIEQWHEGCKSNYDKQVYVEGTVTQANINSLEACKNKMPYPPKPLLVSDCNALRDYEYEKLERAIEVYGYDETYRQQSTENIERLHEICMYKAIEPDQVKCYVELDILVNNHNIIENNLRTGTDGVEHYTGDDTSIYYFEKALTPYNHCMGFENEESQKLFDRLESALYYKSCYELPHKIAQIHCFDSYRHTTMQQGWELLEKTKECSDEYFQTFNAIIKDKGKATSAEESQLLNDVIQCFDDILLTPEPEQIVQSTQKTQPTSEPILCGKGTIEKNGQCVVDAKSSKGGGCLIATATYGSELAPQVQQLRELRDNSLLNTESGTSFMGIFNDVYYSFSPVIADYERENHVFREMIKIVITPMISSLSILNYVDMDSDAEVLVYGISLIILNGLMYVGLPIAGIVVIRKRF